jgi:hypothetical protein
MKKSIGLVFLAFVSLTVLLSGCAPASTSLPPTATPEPPTVFGTLIGSDGAIAEAEITLETYQDEACVKLAEATELSDAEKKQLDDCSSDYASTTSNAEGQYKFSEVTPGWYKLSFTWILNQKPDLLLPLDFKNGFLIAYYETNTTPKVYSALALGEIFQFSGEIDMVINFDYGKP